MTTVTAEATPSQPLFFPPVSYTVFENATADQQAAGNGTPTVKLSVEAAAFIKSDRNEKLPAEVKNVTVELSADDGATWRAYEMKPATGSARLWEAVVEIPEWSEKSIEAAPGAAVETTPAGNATAATGAAVTDVETATTSMAPRMINEGSLETDRGLKKSRMLDVQPPATEQITGSMVRNLPESATAAVCFIAVDSLGNTTAELAHQARPMVEADVHFTTIATDPEETAEGDPDGPGGISVDRDIIRIRAAWLRDKIFVAADIVGSTVVKKMQRSELNYFVLRLMMPDIDGLAEQAGEGLFHYYTVASELFEWPRKSPFGELPFRLIVNREFLVNLIQVMSTPEKELSYELKDFRKNLEKNKTDPSMDIFTKRDVEDSGLEAAHMLSRVYWKINRDAVGGGMELKNIRINVFSGYLDDQRDHSMSFGDRTPYGSMILGHHVLRRNVRMLEMDYSERDYSEARPPFNLPPGATFEQ